MIEPDGMSITTALANKAREDEAAMSVAPPTRLESVPGQTQPSERPGPSLLATTMQQWAQAAPTLPPGALLSIAKAGINPFSPLGDYLVKTAVPALLWKPGTPGVPGQNPQAAADLFGDPAKLAALKSLPMQGLDKVLAQPQDTLASLHPAQISEMGLTGNLNIPDPQDVWSGAIGGVREAGAIAQSGGEFIGMGAKQLAAQGAHEVTNVVHGRMPLAGTDPQGNPQAAQDYTTPSFRIPGLADIPGINRIPGVADNPMNQGSDAGGVPIHFGTAAQLEDPGQLTVVQQYRGNTLGAGILPGGSAVKAAQDTQRAAATVAGHAFTPGRALASFVTTPDSLAYKALSGAVDAYVSLHGDPTILATEAITDAVKARKTIGTVTEDALTATANRLIDTANSGSAVRGLREWAGKTAADEPNLRAAIVDKLANDPNALQGLVEHPDIPVTPKDIATTIVGHKAGLLSGLYDSVHPTNFQQFLVSPEGDKFFQKMGDLSFQEIGHKTGWTMDAKLQLALADAANPDEARQALQDHLSSIRSIPTLGLHPLTDMRWNSLLPTSFADVNDADSIATRLRQDLQLFKVPRSEWNDYIPDGIRAEGDYEKVYAAFKRVGDRSAQNVLAKRPGYASLLAEQADLAPKVRALGDMVVPTTENAALMNRLDEVTAQVRAHEEIAKGFVNYFYERGNQSRLMHNAELGGGILTGGLNPEGGMTPIEGPFGVSELLNRGIPTPGGSGVKVRDIERAVGATASIWNRPIIGKKFLDPVFRQFFVDTIADKLTDTMKTFALGHLGTSVRIIGSQGARMAAAGVGDLSENPLGLLGLVMSDKANIGMTGEELISSLGTAQNKLAAAIGRSTDWRSELAGTNTWTERGWTTFTPKTGNADAIDAWANRLSHSSHDPLGRAVARALIDPASVGPDRGFVRLYRGEGSAFSGENLPEWMRSARGKWFTPDASKAMQYGTSVNYVDVPEAVAEATRVHSGEHLLPDAWATRASSLGGLDAVKQSVWDGELASTRHQMIDANVTWGKNLGDNPAFSRDLVNRPQSDAWVDGWAKIIQTETANHPELLQAVADGIGSDISPQFTRDLANLAKRGIAPDLVTGPIKVEGKAIDNVVKRATNALLSFTAGGPTRDLLMIPTAKRLYMAEAERLLPYLSAEDATSWKALAEAHGVTLPDVAKDATHTITLTQADQIAKTNAVADFQKIFYNPGRRSILTDQLRDIIPFANVIGNTMKSWAQLAAQNPKILRVLQMGVTDAEQSGWWNKDQYGQTQMTMTPGGAISSLIGVPFPMTGQANRLNIVTQGLPSVGPAISWTAPALLGLLGQNKATDALHHYFDPYGDPDFKGGMLEQLFPGWWDKIRTSGFLAKLPGGAPSSQEQVILNHTAMQVMRYKMSTGHYDMSNQDVMTKVWGDSMHDAQIMFLIRGAAQFATPIPPTFDPQTKLKDGSVVQQYIVTTDYANMLKANNYDGYKTTLQFLNKYGPDQIFAAQPFTRPLKYGLPTTAEAQAWAGGHSSFVNKYGAVYGYFAPQAGGFDYNAYLQQIANGTREALTGPKWYQLAEARIGNAVYDQVRKSLPGNLSTAQQAGLAAFKAKLTKEYPGFNQDDLKLANDTSAQTIDQFRGAAADPLVAHTPLAEGIDQYFSIRDAVLEKQHEMGLGAETVSTSARAANLRDALYKAGSVIAASIPEFANVWDNVFSHEVQNQASQDIATP